MNGLEMRDVTVRYGDRVVVDGFTEHVATGGWLGIIGPNGAGKSSLLKAVAGVVAHEGEVVVDGRVLDRRSATRRGSLVAYVPQDPIIPWDMPGFDYAMLGRTPHIGYFGAESAHDRDVVATILAELDLVALGQRAMGALSGGERQRLVIARALATEAPILLLDEPTSALDIGHQQQTLDLVAGLREERGLTVVSAMHDLTLAGLYADRLVLIERGRIAVSGTPADVLRADVLAEHYGVRVSVRHEPDGTVVVIPRR